jgi:hypothetical protein
LKGFFNSGDFCNPGNSGNFSGETFLRPAAYHECHEDLFVVVPAPRPVLACGLAGAGALSVDMVDPVALSHCRHRRGRRAGTVKNHHLPAGAFAGRWKTARKGVDIKEFTFPANVFFGFSSNRVAGIAIIVPS